MSTMVCPSCGRENPAGFQFCGFCTAPLAAPQPRREERKVVTVLFCDLVGFTERSEQMDPEDVRALLRHYHQRLRGELERVGGTVEKFIGDAVVAVFGAPTAHEDDPERAVRAALAIRDWAREEDGLQVRIAVNTGETLVSLGARPSEGEGIVAGDVVNTAARLESAAPANSILVGETTYRATRGVIDYRDADPVAAKGKSKQIPVWEALAAKSRFGVDVRQIGRTQLVGRMAEVAELVAALEDARQHREPRLVTLVGIPGIGKSRLVYELFQFADADPEFITWRQGRSLAYGEGVSFWALGEMVKAQTVILDTDPSDVVAEKLRRAAQETLGESSDGAWVERHLRPLVGLSADAAADEGRTEAFAAWRRFLEALAERGPLVLVFEDLHWADDGLLDFVDHLVEWTRDVPLLVVGTARPELLTRRPNWGGGKPTAKAVSLAPLSDDETARLIHALLGGAIVPAELETTLLERAGGNPLYAEEFARLVAEGDGDIALPESVQGIIAARLDALPIAEKELLQNAAIFGKVFWLGALGAERWTVEERLHALQRKEFVRRESQSSVAGETEYAFWHALVRDVAYDQMPRARRAEKHQAAAEWIDSLTERDDHVEVVAEHYATALDLARAAGVENDELVRRTRVALREAGDRAAALNAYEAAGRLYRRALELWPRDDAERPYVLLACGRVLSLSELGGDDALAESREALLRLGDRESAAEADLALAELTFRRDGDRAAALLHLGRAASLVEDGPPSRAQAWTLSQRARLLMLGRDDEAAIAEGQRAFAIADRLGLEDVRAHALNTLGLARVHVGDPEGVRDLEHSLEVARRIQSSPLVLRGYNNLIAAFDHLGETASAVAVRDEAIREAERFGERALALMLKDNKALAHVAFGEWDEALRLANEVGAEADALRSRFRSSVTAGIRFARGDEHGALADARAAVERLRAMGLPGHLGIALLGLAWMLAETGSVDDAVPLAEEALRLAERAPVAVTFPEAVSVLVACGRGDDLRRVLDAAPSFGRYQGVREHAAGNLERAAEVYAAAGDRTAEAYVHLFAARAGGPEAARHAEAAAAFFRAVGATRHVEELDRLLTAVA